MDARGWSGKGAAVRRFIHFIRGAPPRILTPAHPVPVMSPLAGTPHLHAAYRRVQPGPRNPPPLPRSLFLRVAHEGFPGRAEGHRRSIAHHRIHKKKKPE